MFTTHIKDVFTTHIKDYFFRQSSKMDAELLKAFDTVINFYKTGYVYTNIIGTEIHHHIDEIEREIIEMCGCRETRNQDYWKCDFCGTYKHYPDNIDSYKCLDFDKKRLKNIALDNDELYDRLIKEHQIKDEWIICKDCYKATNDFVVNYTLGNNKIDCKPERIYKAEQLLLKYDMSKKIHEQPNKFTIKQVLMAEEFLQSHDLESIQHNEELLLKYYVDNN